MLLFIAVTLTVFLPLRISRSFSTCWDSSNVSGFVALYGAVASFICSVDLCFSPDISSSSGTFKAFAISKAVYMFGFLPCIMLSIAPFLIPFLTKQ